MSNIKYLTRLLGFTAIFTFLSACSFPGVYKLTIQQGNIVTQDMLDKLKPGMTKKQVAYIMGTPLAKSPFLQTATTNQWDYIYTLEKREKVVKRYHIKLFFENELYTQYEGEAPASEILKDVPEKDKEKPLQEQKLNLQQAPAT